jgi:hypothetical protein
MVVKVTIAQVRTAIEGIGSFMEAKLPARLAFQLVTLVTELESKLVAAQKVQKQLAETYGKRDAEGQLVVGTDDKGNEIPESFVLADPDAFAKEMQELLDSEVEVTTTLSRSEIETALTREDVDAVIRPSDILRLGSFLTD